MRILYGVFSIPLFTLLLGYLVACWIRKAQHWSIFSMDRADTGEIAIYQPSTYHSIKSTIISTHNDISQPNIPKWLSIGHPKQSPLEISKYVHRNTKSMQRAWIKSNRHYSKSFLEWNWHEVTLWNERQRLKDTVGTIYRPWQRALLPKHINSLGTSLGKF